MPNFCAAPNCTRKSTQSDLAFFRFPRDPSRCQKWVENCRRADLEDKTPDQLNKHYRLCAQHFEDSMICRSSPYRTGLRENAIPTIFDLTSHLGNPGRRRKRIKELSEDEIRTLKENKRTEMVFGLHPSFVMASKSFLDIELLIALVRLHPELYDPRNASYNDTDRRLKLWNQISSEIFLDWDDLHPQQRYMKVKEVQTQWQTLKDSFRRELSREMKRSGPAFPPSPDASHFKDLLFLKPVMMMMHVTDRRAEPPAVTRMNNDPAEVTEEDLDIIYVKEEPPSPHSSSARAETASQIVTHPAAGTQQPPEEFSQNETGLVDGLSEQDQKEDPHMDFARSLVPYLAQVPDNHQASLRMALANVIFCYIENTQGCSPTASPQLLQYISPHGYPTPSPTTRNPNLP